MGRIRRVMVTGASIVGLLGAAATGSVALSTTVAGAATGTPLTLSQTAAFSVLGYWCGGITETAYATGFTGSSGFPMGDVYLSTTCNGSGRGGHSITHTSWAAVTWDLTGAVVTLAAAGSPTVTGSFSTTDSAGNEVYNSVGRAYLLLATGFVPSPRVTGLSVTSGPASGGTSVTITGTGFSGVTAVDFGAVAAQSYSVNGPTSIVAVTPTTVGGQVVVTVTNAGGTSLASTADQFTFVPQPTIIRLSPSSGPITGGNEVTIVGTGLTAVTVVRFGETPIGFSITGPGAVTIYVPVGARTDPVVPVSVTSLGGTSPASPADQYTYVAAGAAKVSVTPASGPPLTVVNVTGQGFSPGETVRVTFRTDLTASPSTLICKAVASATGTITCGGHIPKAAYAGALGAHPIWALGSVSHRKATTTFVLN